MKRRLATAAVLALLAGGCKGKGTPTEPQITATLVGSVTYGAGAVPLAGASVSVRGASTAATTTDTHGAFVFPFLAVGPTVVTLSAPQIDTYSETLQLGPGNNYVAYHRPAK